MKPYAVMVQTDADDRFFADSTLSEIQSGTQIEYIPHTDDLGNLIEEKGMPQVILINDSSIRPAREQLKKVKTNRELGHIPVVILGELATDDYIRDYYRAGANSYIIKPSTVQATRKKIETFFEYWFEVAEV